MSIVSGDFEPAKPTMLLRTDGAGLLYPGLVHALNGESESGKSWIAQYEASQTLKAGLPVLYVDAESDPASIVDRLRKLGCSDEQIVANFDYRQPETGPEGDLLGWHDMMSREYALAVVDGVTDSLGLFNFSINENDDVARWMRVFPRQIADKTGAAVVLIDHVTKSSDGRGRFAIGAQAKMASLNGAAYVVEVVDPLAVGRTGRLRLKVAKDRPGQVRSAASTRAGKDRTQHVADFVLASTEAGEVEVDLYPPRDESAPQGGSHGAPDHIEGAVMEYVRDALAGGLTPSRTDVVKGTYGRHQGGPVKMTRDQIEAAVTNLCVDRKLVAESGPRRAVLLRLARPEAMPFWQPGVVTE